MSTKSLNNSYSKALIDKNKNKLLVDTYAGKIHVDWGPL